VANLIIHTSADAPMRTLFSSLLLLTAAAAAAGAQSPRVIATVTGGRGTDYFHSFAYPSDAGRVTSAGLRLSVAPIAWRHAALALAGSAEQHRHDATYLLGSPRSRVRQWTIGPELRLTPAGQPLELRAAAFAGRIRRTYTGGGAGGMPSVVDELNGTTSHPLHGFELGAGMRVRRVGLGYALRHGYARGITVPPDPLADLLYDPLVRPLARRTASFRRHGVEVSYGFSW